jgi:hypothetical protein
VLIDPRIGDRHIGSMTFDISFADLSYSPAEPRRSEPRIGNVM